MKSNPSLSAHRPNLARTVRVQGAEERTAEAYSAYVEAASDKGNAANGPLSTDWQHGFTLLEVMVALAVLGLNLGVIIAGQSIAFSRANIAKDMVGAVAVVRAKILDIEQKLIVDGLGDFDKEEEEECDRTVPMYRCEWTLKRVELPIGQMLEAAAAKAGEIQSAAADKIADDARRSGATVSTAAAGPSVVGLLGNFKGPIQMIQQRMEEGLRELRVTVKWREAKDSTEWQSFSAVTHLVDFKAMSGGLALPAAGAAPGAAGITAAVPIGTGSLSSRGAPR